MGERFVGVVGFVLELVRALGGAVQARAGVWCEVAGLL